MSQSRMRLSEHDRVTRTMVTEHDTHVHPPGDGSRGAAPGLYSVEAAQKLEPGGNQPGLVRPGKTNLQTASYPSCPSPRLCPATNPFTYR